MQIFVDEILPAENINRENAAAKGRETGRDQKMK